MELRYKQCSNEPLWCTASDKKTDIIQDYMVEEYMNRTTTD